MIISSRESLFDEVHFKHKRFQFLQIQPLTEPMQTDVLLRRFKHDGQLVESFQREQRGSQNLMEMGSNPLLLALLIGVFIVDKHKLPERRTELYEKGVELMVRGGARNKMRKASLLSPNTAKKQRGRDGGRARVRPPKNEVKMQTLHALLCRIGHYLHVVALTRDFAVYEVTEMVSESDWGDVTTSDVQDAWTDLQNDSRGLIMCVEVDPERDGDPEQDIYRSTHLTFQEFLAAKQCVQGARAAANISDYFDETFGSSPNPWLREVLLMVTELLSPEEFEQVAMHYLRVDDGSGATSVRVDQMLESRREDRTRGVGLRIMKELGKTRSTEMMVKGLRHPCEELRDLALTEIEKFQMPKEEVVASLLDLTASTGTGSWYEHLAGIQSLGKLQVKSDNVVSALVRIGLDRTALPDVIKAAVRAIKTLNEENSDLVATRVVELLQHGTSEERMFAWTSVIKSTGIEHPEVIAALRETISDAEVKAFLDRLDDPNRSDKLEPEPEPEPELELEPELESELGPEPEPEQGPPDIGQQISEARSKLTLLGIVLTAEDEQPTEDEKVHAINEMLDVVDSVIPGPMAHAKTLFEQADGQFKTQVFDKLLELNDEHVNIGAALCWSTQEAAVQTLLHRTTDQCSSEEAQRALACIQSFESSLRSQSTLVLGIALQSCSDTDGGGDADDLAGLAADPFVERLLCRLEAPCPFAFAPLLHYFRAVLDPGTDPRGERAEALRGRFDSRLQVLGQQRMEAVFLRRELQV
jgi:hypothetical protein